MDLKNGITFLLPCALVQGLAEAGPEEIAQVRLGPRGASLHWEKLNVDFSLAGLMAGDFGTQAWMDELHQRQVAVQRLDISRKRRRVRYDERPASTVVIREGRKR